jgi:hypothetical protein
MTTPRGGVTTPSSLSFRAGRSVARAKNPCGEDRLSRRSACLIISTGIPPGVGMTTPRGGVTTPSSLSFRAGRSVARAKNPCGEDRLSRRSVGWVVSLGIPPGVGMTTPRGGMTTLTGGVTTPSSLLFRAGRSVARAKNPCGEDRLSRRCVGRVVSLGIPPGVGMTTIDGRGDNPTKREDNRCPLGLSGFFTTRRETVILCLNRIETDSSAAQMLRVGVSHGGILDRDPNSLSR